MQSHQTTMFYYVSHVAEVLTPDIEAQISRNKAWATVVPAGETKPEYDHIGAFVVQPSFSDLEQKIENLDRKLKEKVRLLEQSDMVLASHVARIDNLLADNDILKRDKQRIHDAHSMLYSCVVCMEEQRKIRFSPCGHVVVCQACTDTIMNSREGHNRRCPVCRTVISDTQVAFVT